MNFQNLQVIDPSMNNETLKVPITCLKHLGFPFSHFLFQCFLFNYHLFIFHFSGDGWSFRFLFHLRFGPPEDGFPCCEDWSGCFESMLFAGIELAREPLDGSVDFVPGLQFK